MNNERESVHMYFGQLAAAAAARSGDRVSDSKHVAGNFQPYIRSVGSDQSPRIANPIMSFPHQPEAHAKLRLHAGAYTRPLLSST